MGCQGLGLEDGCDVLVRSAWPEFADAVAGLLAQPGWRDRIAGAARATVERRFGWQAIAVEAYASYLAVAGKP